MGAMVAEILGVLAAMLSSGLGGTAVGATRYVVGATDPLTLGAFRFGVGVVFLLPVTMLRRGPWPARSDWPAVAGLGLLFFFGFPILFNASLAHTTAARGALALSTLPLLTMVAGAAMGMEALTLRKTGGVLIAMGGVAVALLAGMAHAPSGAWQGDLLMVAAALTMALYSVWSRPFIRTLGPIAFTAQAMGVGAAALVVVAAARGGFAAAGDFGTAQWLAVGYLGIFGSALVFFLWAFALSRTTPTRVAISVTVNPIAASILGAVLLDEPIRWNVVVGLVAVLTGIWLATIGARQQP